ncbi:MAG TPA: outer membrane beta-barrel protein [Holophagaceae bacterium]|nr:outer membrane beta-barrel protein [Holophagaceae bacterium]
MRMAAAAAWAVLGIAGACHAGDVGIGVSLKTDDSAIYVPWKLSPHLMLEGRLEYQRYSSESTNPGLGSTEYKMTTYSLGAGLFGQSRLTESTRMYAGGRLSYIDQKQDQGPYLPGFYYKDSRHGWAVAPTLGVEYFPIKQLSLGAEVGLSYAKLNGVNSGGGADSTARTSSTDTVSALIVRYYF